MISERNAADSKQHFLAFFDAYSRSVKKLKSTTDLGSFHFNIFCS